MADLDPIHFTPGGVDITLTPPASPQAVGTALAANQPFPANAFTNGVIPLGSIGAKADKKFTIKGADGDSRITFLDSVTVGGKLFAGFGVYRSVDKLIEDLTAQGLAEELNEPAVTGPIFPAPPPPRDYYVMRWGYEASVEAKGALPLGVLPPITFGGSARKAGLFAIVRSHAPDAKSLDAVTDTLNSWTLPQKATSPDKLKPGTWVIAENDGSLSFNLGLEYGYDYSWVRESLKVGGLSGDLGVKIEMGVKAGLGFTASGRYATVVSRESDREELRLRVFRMRQHGWTFNFNATVGAQLKVDDKLFPAKFEDFIKGIFNVNGNQVLKDFVDTFDKWSDPNSSIADLLGEELVERAKALFEKVTGKNPETEFEAGRKLLTDAIDRWRGLPHELSSLLYGLLKKAGVPLDELRDFLRTVKDLTDPKRLADEITSRIEAARFHESPIGKWLTAVAKGGITDLLTSLSVKAERDRFIALADKTIALLDGSKVETLLKELQTWIEDKLGLDKIMAVVTATDFKTMDAWLKKRLADFLDKKLGEVVFADVKKIQQAIQTLRDNAQKFYDKGREALTQKYKAEFDFSYSKTTTKTALIDVTFDFAANPSNASARLKEAIKGDFTKLLSEPQAGVKLNKGVLTHGIKRNTHLAIGLPFFKSAVDHITTSEAKVNIVDTDGGGRLWVFNLKAEDTVSKKHSLSKLTISLEFSRMMGVRKFSTDELSEDVFKYNYQLRMVRRGARRAFLENKVGPLADEYLASQFKVSGKGDFSTYLTTLDKLLDGTGLADDDFGNLLVAFDVSMPSGAFAAWGNAPAENNHETYLKLSVDMQRLLRRLTLDAYTQDEDHFKAPQRKMMYPLLVYSALPDINKLRFTTASQQLKFTRDAVLDWDPSNGDLRNKLFADHCAQTLRTVILPRLEKELKGNDAALQFYANTQTNIENIINFNLPAVGQLSDKSQAVANFVSLALSEITRINGIRDAAVKFNSLNTNKTEEAIKKLSEFGASFVNSFNQGLNERYKGTEYRPFGTVLFAETAKAFGATAEQTRPVAMLEMLVLPKDTAYNLKDFLTGNRPGEDVKLLHEARVVTST